MIRSKRTCLSILLKLAGLALLQLGSSALAQSRPATASSIPFRSMEEVEAERHRLEAELDEALNDPKRSKWNLLPGAVSDVFFDQRGQAWFRMQVSPKPGTRVPPEAMKRAVEDAVAGKTRAVQGSVILIDKLGRVWSRTLDSIERYDGRQWKNWPLGSADKVSRRSDPSNSRLDPNDDGRYWLQPMEAAMEDSAGNCWFAADGANSRGLSLLRILPDGTKKQDWIDDPMSSQVGMQNYAQCGFFEQPGGRIVFVLPMATVQGSASSLTTLRAFLFDGQTWKPITPHFCDHQFNYVIPQDNGSIKFVCKAGRIWTYWPDDMIETTRKQVKEWFESLDDPDAQKRASAHRGLLTVGPQLNELLPKADDESLSPASRSSLRKIRENYAEMAKVDEKGLHASLTFYDAGLEVGAAMPIARTRNGGAVLSAMPVRQAGQQDLIPRAFLWIDSTGKYTVKPAESKYFMEPVAGSGYPGLSWGDMGGSLWRRATSAGPFAQQDSFSAVLRPDGQYVHATPPGSLIDEIIGEDAGGLLYFRLVGGGIVVHDSKLSSTANWRSLTIEDEGMLRTNRDGSAGYSVLVTENSSKLLRLGPDGARPVTLPERASLSRMVPLLGNSLLIDAVTDADLPYYFDGKEWISDKSMSDLVQANVASLLQVVPTALVNLSSAYFVAAVRDTAGRPQGMWFYADSGIAERQRAAARPTTRAPVAATGPATTRAASARGPVPAVPDSGLLRYFDGAAWHDATEQIRAAVPAISARPFHVADHGRAALLMGGRGRGVWVTYKAQGRFDVKPFEFPPIVNPSAAIAVADRAGGIWLGNAPTTPAPSMTPLVYISSGEAQALAGRFYNPRLCDKAGQMWFTDVARRMLIVKREDQWHEVMVKGIESSGPLLEGPDGRIWLFLRDALVLVALVDDAGKPRLATERFPWDGPKSLRNPPFIDSANGLWMHGYASKLSRYVLPSTKVPAMNTVP